VIRNGAQPMLPFHCDPKGREESMIDNSHDLKGDTPTEKEELAAAADAAVNEGGKSKEDLTDEIADVRPKPNPPYTTTGKYFTTPKFGSAGSGGLENEPGLEED
jgi:hypothetical protein